MISEIYRTLLRAVGSEIQYHVQEDGSLASYLGVLAKTLARRPLILTGFPESLEANIGISQISPQPLSFISFAIYSLILVSFGAVWRDMLIALLSER